VKRKKDDSMYFNDDSIHFNDDDGSGPYGDVEIQEGSGSRSGPVRNENGIEFAQEDEIPHLEGSNEVFSILQAIREGEISSESLQESIRIPSWSNQNNLKHLLSCLWAFKEVEFQRLVRNSLLRPFSRQ
jgi:hypothetical protein